MTTKKQPYTRPTITHVPALALREEELLLIGAAVTWAGATKSEDVAHRRLAEDRLQRAVSDWQLANVAAAVAQGRRG